MFLSSLSLTNKHQLNILSVYHAQRPCSEDLLTKRTPNIRMSAQSPTEKQHIMELKREIDSTTVEKPATLNYSNKEANDTRKRRFYAVLYVAITTAIALFSYYIGTLRILNITETELPPQLIVENLWATPLVRTHLKTHPSAANLTQFNTRLAEAVAEDHAAFSANMTDVAPSEINDLFFEHQVGDDDENSKVVRARIESLKHRQLDEFRVVARCAANLADRIIQKFGEAAAEGCGRRLQSWATLHDSSSRHALHVHAASTLSIVYYVKMGEGAPLRLFDPRGPRPPFEGSIEVWPEEGEMIAFPGWLAHEVEAGVGQRISLVFNVPGNWEGDEFGGDTIGLGRWGAVKGWKLDFGDGIL